MGTCAKCGAGLSGGAFPTPLGERICASCHDKIVAAVIGVGQGSLGTAIALAGNDDRPGHSGGILAWIRRSLNPRG